MKQIPLTQGKVALVDDEDYDYLNQWKWYAQKDRKTFYAVRRNGNGRMKMHRIVLGLNDDSKLVPDHIDFNGLNNQKSNLRIATQLQNAAYRPAQKATSDYKGVSPNKRGKKWRVDITKNGIHTYIGSFENENDAALAYNKIAKELHGEFAYLNNVAV